MNFNWVKSCVNATKGCIKTGTVIVKAHAPEILIVGGLAGFGGTIYGAIKATNKTHEILDEQEEALMDLEDAEKKGIYVDPDARNRINRKARWKIIKAYLPVGTMAISSTAMILGGYKVLNGRYVGMIGAYKMIESQFGRYRDNVVDEFGTETDWRMLNNVKKEDMEAALKEREDNKEIEEDNKRKLMGKVKPKTKYSDITSQIFDSNSRYWKRYWNAEMMLDYLEIKEHQLTDKLYLDKVLFDNDVNDALGLPRVAEGQLLGKVWRPGARVCLGAGGLPIKDSLPPEEMRRLLATERNEDLYMRIHINHDGVVYKELMR